MAKMSCQKQGQTHSKILSIKKIDTYCSLITISNVKIRNNETKQGVKLKFYQ